MRISGNQSSDNFVKVTSQKIEQVTVQENSSDSYVQEIKAQVKTAVTNLKINEVSQIEKTEENTNKLEKAVNSLNDLMETTNSTSKFMFHEGLERYYVTVVDRETEEVIKEIPPKRLLDAFYELQKLAGMIVDEKI